MSSITGTLGCTDKHVYNLIQDGALKAMKLGDRTLRVSEQKLQDFIASHIVNPEDCFAPVEPAPEPRVTQ